MRPKTLLVLGLIGLALGLGVLAMMIAEPVWYGWLLALVLFGNGVRSVVLYRRARRDPS